MGEARRRRLCRCTRPLRTNSASSTAIVSSRRRESSSPPCAQSRGAKSTPFMKTCSSCGIWAAAAPRASAPASVILYWRPRRRTRRLVMDGRTSAMALAASSLTGVFDRSIVWMVRFSLNWLSAMASSSWVEKRRSARWHVSFSKVSGLMVAAILAVMPSGTTSRLDRSLQLMQMEWNPIKKNMRGLSTPRMTLTAARPREPCTPSATLTSSQRRSVSMARARSSDAQRSGDSAGMSNSSKPRKAKSYTPSTKASVSLADGVAP
mmetsp:Transcript_13644/g.40242  ORF Transcript_13644/g.40242 Transcript_13644/m.40242 type:complete len:264 (-) Transcript_13644:145-936(-)